ncbi:MAG: hypothetical protein Q8M15_08545 [Bacteroidota bacterium]|nr:hypothetical protein [Bacteroidota bacterium]
MHTIIFISTVHKATGKCSAEELCKIINELSPEVIFLEALHDTYTEYQKLTFKSFGVYHKKLEISAIQRYSLIKPFKYVPVLDKGLSDSFEKKYNLVCENSELQKLNDRYNSLAEMYGFEFLNGVESIKLQEEMRAPESHLLNGHVLDKEAKDDINTYEDSMIRNIYLYCKNNHFNSAIYKCGVAHRKSIIEKIGKHNGQEQIKLNWIVFGS